MCEGHRYYAQATRPVSALSSLPSRARSRPPARRPRSTGASLATTLSLPTSSTRTASIGGPSDASMGLEWMLLHDFHDPHLAVIKPDRAKSRVSRDSRHQFYAEHSKALLRWHTLYCVLPPLKSTNTLISLGILPRSEAIPALPASTVYISWD